MQKPRNKSQLVEWLKKNKGAELALTWNRRWEQLVNGEVKPVVRVDGPVKRWVATASSHQVAFEQEGKTEHSFLNIGNEPAENFVFDESYFAIIQPNLHNRTDYQSLELFTLLYRYVSEGKPDGEAKKPTIPEGLNEKDIKACLNCSAGDVNYKMAIQRMGNEELKYVYENETRKTGMNQARTEARKRGLGWAYLPK